MRSRLGALAERNFRLVFTSTTISALGDGVSTIALTLAVGVWADRLPRHLVLVAAAVVQGGVQAVSAVLAPTLGGVLVGLGSPGSALLVDAASFAVAAVLLVRLSIAPRDDAATPEPFLAELRQGWHEFRRQTWIWAIEDTAAEPLPA